MTTTALELTERADHLRHLARDFQALHQQVREVTLTPGTETLRHLAPLVLKSHELLGKAILHLSALDASPYTEVSGSRESLIALGTVVSGASLASCDLAHALAANPLDSIGFGGPHHDEAGIRRTRHAQAAPEMAAHLADAAQQLEVCETACRYLATGITRDLAALTASTSDQQKPHKISPTQHEALRALATGGATMETRGRGTTIVRTPDHTRVTIATFQSLDKHGLVHLDTSVPLYRGRGITVTAEGQRALTQHRAHIGVGTPPATAPHATAASKGTRR